MVADDFCRAVCGRNCRLARFVAAEGAPPPAEWLEIKERIFLLWGMGGDCTQHLSRGKKFGAGRIPLTPDSFRRKGKNTAAVKLLPLGFGAGPLLHNFKKRRQAVWLPPKGIPSALATQIPVFPWPDLAVHKCRGRFWKGFSSTIPGKGFPSGPSFPLNNNDPPPTDVRGTSHR